MIRNFNSLATMDPSGFLHQSFRVHLALGEVSFLFDFMAGSGIGRAGRARLSYHGASTAIFSFIHHWNDFLNPLIFIDTERWRTLALALRYLINQFTFCCARTPTPWNILMAASVVMLVPILILFFSAQRYFIRGIALSGLGGR